MKFRTIPHILFAVAGFSVVCLFHFTGKPRFELGRACTGLPYLDACHHG